EVEQLGILAEEMLADVRAGLDGVALVFAVDDLAHAPREEARPIAREERIPVVAPEHLDHVPAGAAERGLELLDDLAVAPDRPVEALEIAIDDPGQVVEVLP